MPRSRWEEEGTGGEGEEISLYNHHEHWPCNESLWGYLPNSRWCWCIGAEKVDVLPDLSGGRHHGWASARNTMCSTTEAPASGINSGVDIWELGLSLEHPRPKRWFIFSTKKQFIVLNIFSEMPTQLLRHCRPFTDFTWMCSLDQSQRPRRWNNISKWSFSSSVRSFYCWGT